MLLDGHDATFQVLHALVELLVGQLNERPSLTGFPVNLCLNLRHLLAKTLMASDHQIELVEDILDEHARVALGVLDLFGEIGPNRGDRPGEPAFEGRHVLP
ncbi:MAG: hypothetical protein AB1411_16940 [Nitrospirota bacterium]